MTGLRFYPTLEALPTQCDALFAATARQNFALDRAWFGNLVDNGLEADSEPLFGVFTSGADPIALVPLQQSLRQRSIGSLTNIYTCLYSPLIPKDGIPPEIVRWLGREFGHFCRDWPVVRIDCLPTEWSGLASFCAGLSDARVAVRRFDHFGNWYEPVTNQSWESYVASRPGPLRELLRRKYRRSQQVKQLEFEIIRTPAGLSQGIEAFERVYRRSWKSAEPFSRFNPGLMQTAATRGALRLGICWKGMLPVAVQFWILSDGGNATIMKLAHDDEYAALSPGTLLTATMIKTLIEDDAVQELDFGRGDDPYKRLWVKERRQRIGLILASRHRLRGFAVIARHDLSRALKRIRRDVRVARTHRPH
jgi:hypothetical protein